MGRSRSWWGGPEPSAVGRSGAGWRHIGRGTELEVSEVQVQLRCLELFDQLQGHHHARDTLIANAGVGQVQLQHRGGTPGGFGEAQVPNLRRKFC